MSTVARTPRALAGVVLLVAALVWAVVGAVRSSDTTPGADPWLVAAMVLAGAYLLCGALVAEQRRRVSAAARRHHRGLPMLLAGDELTGESTGIPAWSSRRTQAGWRAAVRRAWWAPVAALVVALAVALPLRSYRQADAALVVGGVHTDAQVLSARWAYEGRGGRPVADVAYTFDGHPYTARVASPVPAAIPRGTQLQLLVDASHPDHVRVDSVPGTSSAIEWWTTIGGLSALALLAVGVRTLLHLLDRRRRYQAGPWIDATIVGRGALAMLRTRDCTTPVRCARHQLPASSVRVMAGPGATILAELPHGTSLVLRRPATFAEGRRWWTALPGEYSRPGEDRHEEVAAPAVEGPQVPRREATVDA